MTVSIYIHINSVRGFTFFHTLSSINACEFFDDGRSDQCDVIVVLICFSLIISDAEHLVTCFLAIYMSSLEKCLVRSSAQVLIEFLFFFYIELYELFVYFGD